MNNFSDQKTDLGNVTSDKILKAGVWRRVCAAWLDFLAVFVIVWLIAEAAQTMGVYVAREMSFLIIAIVYGIVFMLWKGRTPGKVLCGLLVSAQSRGPVSNVRLILRESLGKFLSFAVCFLGIAAFVLWKPLGLRQYIPFGMLIPLVLGVFGTLFAIVLQRKKLLHDRIGNTIVIQQKGSRFAPYGITFATITLLVLLVSHAYSWYATGQVSGKLKAQSGYVLPAHSRTPEDLTELGELGEVDKRDLAGWLDEYGSSPMDYIVQKASQHQLLIFGEQHEQKETLQLFNEMIPILYERAGITRIGMEVFMAAENQAMEELVLAKEFDHQGALELARRMDSWGVWGHKGYWQVLETVWQLNQTIPEGKPKVKLVGLGVPIDVMSYSMVGMELNAGSHTPVWEKLRLARILSDMPQMMARDALMAQEAITGILEEGTKGVLLIGSSHSTIRCPLPGKVQSSKTRMGFMLSQKYPEDVFQIVVHRVFAMDEPGKPGMDEFLEGVMAHRSHNPVGFDVESSPFSTIRDSASWEFTDPRLGLGDIATGYIYLAPLKEINKCDWVPNYVSQPMYVANKPFYKSWGNHWNKTVASAEDVNEFFVTIN